MEMVVSLVVPFGDAGGQRSEGELDRLPVVVHGVGCGEGEGLLRVAGVEGDAGGDAGVVGAAGAVLVGLGDGDGDRALRVLGEGDLDGYSAALGHGVGGLLELHVHVGGEVVVVDGDDGLVGGAFRHSGGQVVGAEGELDRLAVVVHRVGGGGEGEGLLGVAAVEGDAGGDAGVVGAGGAVLVGLGDGDGHRPLRVGGQGDGDRDLVLLGLRGGRVVGLLHAVGGRAELHRHRRARRRR